MPVVEVTAQEKEVLNAYRTAPQLKVAMDAMVALVQSGELSAKLAGALEQASGVLPEPKIVATPTGARADLPDTREGFAPHRAYLFSVAASKGIVLDELEMLLGEEAATLLVIDWGDRCNLNQKLQATEVSLYLDSNNKARNRDYAPSDDKTTQEEDFTATKHQFAADLAATLLCARIVKKARVDEPLSEGERDLYQKLKVGVLRSCSGALVIIDNGRLRADRFFFGNRSSADWALGSPLSPESN